MDRQRDTIGILSQILAPLKNLQQKSIELKESLEDSLVYHELVKDVHDAILWEKEKTALVSSTDFGNSLVEVQAMMKRHQVIIIKDNHIRVFFNDFFFEILVA